jgi:hypothetical protein
MNIDVMSLAQVRAVGLEALSKALGPVGLVRFLQQYETGTGDYTRERHEWLGEATVRDLAQELAQRRIAHTDQVEDRPCPGTGQG